MSALCCTSVEAKAIFPVTPVVCPLASSGMRVNCHPAVTPAGTVMVSTTVAPVMCCIELVGVIVLAAVICAPTAVLTNVVVRLAGTSAVTSARSADTPLDPLDGVAITLLPAPVGRDPPDTAVAVILPKPSFSQVILAVSLSSNTTPACREARGRSANWSRSSLGSRPPTPCRAC